MLSVRGQWLCVAPSWLISDFKSYSEKEDLEGRGSCLKWPLCLDGWFCGVLLTCVWTTHHLLCFIYSSFTGQCERKTDSFTVCKVEEYPRTCQTQECSNSHADGQSINQCVCSWQKDEQNLWKRACKSLLSYGSLCLFILFHGMHAGMKKLTHLYCTDSKIYSLWSCWSVYPSAEDSSHHTRNYHLTKTWRQWKGNYF